MISFKTENMADLREELTPMFEEHQEFFAFPEFNPNPQWDMYDHCYSNGSHVFYTARETGTDELVGYVGYFVTDAPHYSEEVLAAQDLFFIDERYRGSGLALELLEMAEDLLVKDKGITYISLALKSNFSSGSLAHSAGYIEEEKIYLKNVGGL